MHCITLEANYGVPTALDSHHILRAGGPLVAFAQGMPRQRFVFVPTPVMGKSPRELRAYVDGHDPITGRPVMEEVIEALTTPLSTEEIRPSRLRALHAAARRAGHRGEPAPALPGEPAGPTRLPIVLPTEERVAAMLAGTSHQPDEIVGRMRPTRPARPGTTRREGRRQRGDGRRRGPSTSR